MLTVSLAEGTCYQSCSACPEGERYYCEDDLCKYDELPWVEIVEAELELEVGVEGTFTAEARAADGRVIATWAWRGTAHGFDTVDLGQLGDGPSLTRAFGTAGDVQLVVEVEDEAGLMASAATTVSICLPGGSMCESYEPCCGGNVCVSQLDGGYLCEAEPQCGDGTRTGNEACDGNDLGGQTCETVGYAGGVLACGNTCQFDISSCSL